MKKKFRPLELLSMGQSLLARRLSVLEENELDWSVYLSGPNRRGLPVVTIRTLAIRHVLNLLGEKP